VNAGALKQTTYSFLLAIVCLVAVYVPTFLLVSLLIKSGSLGKVTPDELQIAAAPFIICISAAIALGIMAVLARRRGQSLATFGFKRPSLRHALMGLGLGVVCAYGLHALGSVLPIHATLDMGPMQRWQLILYFWIGAPIQEEVIFRGLIQSVVETRHPDPLRLGKFPLPFSVLVSALLFAVVHIGTARLGASLSQVLFIVSGAFVLGLLAGWLRWRSGSLAPGILVHALFNMLAG